MNRGIKLWNKAKKIIPGGTQLLSKRSEQFLPDQWPSYFKKAKGVEVWDLDNNHYIDMSIMGVGACVLRSRGGRGRALSGGSERWPGRRGCRFRE